MTLKELETELHGLLSKVETTAVTDAEHIVAEVKTKIADAIKLVESEVGKVFGGATP